MQSAKLHNCYGFQKEKPQGTIVFCLAFHPSQWLGGLDPKAPTGKQQEEVEALKKRPAS